MSDPGDTKKWETFKGNVKEFGRRAQNLFWETMGDLGYENDPEAVCQNFEELIAGTPIEGITEVNFVGRWEEGKRKIKQWISDTSSQISADKSFFEGIKQIRRDGKHDGESSHIFRDTNSLKYMTSKTRDGIFDLGSRKYFSKKVLKFGIVILAAAWGGKRLRDHMADKRRSSILKHLPQQNLSWYHNNRVKNKFREHNFYVTQFPMTPHEEFPRAVEMVYFMLKYLGAVELKNKWASFTARSKLKRECSAETLEKIEDLKHKSLDTIFRSPVIKEIFSLPPSKRIDVEIFDATTKPIRLLRELREELWTPGQLYGYLNNSKYVVHVYDLGEYKLTHFLPISHPWAEDLKKYNGATKVLYNIRHLKGLQTPDEYSLIGLSSDEKKRRWNSHHPKGQGNVWDGFGRNVAFAKYTIIIKGKKSKLEGLVFTRSGADSEKLMFVNHSNLRSIFEVTTLPGEVYEGRKYDAERKILLALYQYFKDDWKALQSIEIELYTEDIPCDSCKAIIKDFRNVLKENGKKIGIHLYVLNTEGKPVNYVRKKIYEGSKNYKFEKL
ncbi:MAG TPA: deaminase domain-containing protein [Patescibacteria group bacterium]|nr:deaminase domain-containing protein [Patescibacteria group bacterium]